MNNNLIKKIILLIGLISVTTVFVAKLNTIFRPPLTDNNVLKKVKLSKTIGNTVELKLITTKKMLSKPLIFERGKNVYLISLPEMDFKGERKVNFSNLDKYITDATIDFVPYKTSNKHGGYTRIIVKTKDDIKIDVKNTAGFTFDINNDLPIPKAKLAKLLKLLGILGGIIVIAGGSLFIYIRNKNKKMLNNILENTDDVFLEDVLENNENNLNSAEQEAVLEFLDEHNTVNEEFENVEVNGNTEINEDASILEENNPDDYLADAKFVEDTLAVQEINDNEIINTSEQFGTNENMEEPAIEDNEIKDNQEDSVVQEEIAEEINEEQSFDEEYIPSADEIVNDILNNDDAVEAISETILDNMNKDIEENLETDYNLDNLDNDETKNTLNNDIIEDDNEVPEDNSIQNDESNYSTQDIVNTSIANVFVPSTTNLNFTQEVETNEEITENQITDLIEEIIEDNENQVVDTFEENEQEELENQKVDIFDENLEILENEEIIEQGEIEENNEEILEQEDNVILQDEIADNDENQKVDIFDENLEILDNEEITEQGGTEENNEEIMEQEDTLKASEEAIDMPDVVDEIQDVSENIIESEFDIGGLDGILGGMPLDSELEPLEEIADNFEEELVEDNQDQVINIPDENIEISENNETLVENENIIEQENNILPENTVIDDNENLTVDASDTNVEIFNNEEVIEQDETIENNEKEEASEVLNNTDEMLISAYEVNEDKEEEKFETTDFFKESENNEDNADEQIPESFFKNEFDYESENEEQENVSYFKEDNIEEEPNDSEPIVISEKEIESNKMLYLIRHEGQFSLIGIQNENVYVLNRFANEPKKTTICTKLNETNEDNNIYIVKVDKWRALISISDNNMENLLTLS